ncbi:MAG: cyclase family protein [Bacillota bacterium]
MEARIIDVTHTLSPDFAAWPGDTPFQRERTARISEGSSVNLSRLTLSLHTGTHVDAPIHYVEDGIGMEEMDLSIFVGRASVVDVSRGKGPIDAGELSDALELLPASDKPKTRLLIRSGYVPEVPFARDFRYLLPEAVELMSHRGVRLVGTDAPSVDAFDSKTLPAHKACGRYGINILEFLDLSDVARGEYRLLAAPLKIAGADGSPVRAVLLPGN